MDTFKIKQELVKIMQRWLENTAANKPWVSEKTAELMADAAISILETQEDLENTLKDQGYDIP